MNKIKISAAFMSVVFTFGSFASAENSTDMSTDTSTTESSVVTSTVISTDEASVAKFTDMPTDEVTAAAINNAVKNGLLSGYEDGTVRPDANIKRSEMAVIITNACKVEKEGNISRFGDVKETDWFYSAMAKAYEMGAFAGDGVNMNPNNNITFQECFTVLSEVFDLVAPYQFLDAIPETIPANKFLSGRRLYDISCLNQFTDKADIAEWAIPYVAGVVSRGGFSGIDGKAMPKEYITRAQFATVMDNLIKTYIDKPGEYKELPVGNVMVRCNGAIFKDIEIKGDIYVGDSVSANEITIENVTADRLVVRGCAEPTENKDGELTYNEANVGITVSGTFNAVRVIRPYIHINTANAKYKQLPYSVPDTNFIMGIISL